MRRGLLLVLAAAAAIFAVPATARAAACGLPDATAQSPLWIDFADGTVPFRVSVFGRPGEAVATNGTLGPALRARGAQTVYWEMHLERWVGVPGAPAVPDSVGAAADALFSRAVTTTGCATPVIALNEMEGVTSAAPLSGSATQYRLNVLAFVQELASRGATPYLLLPSNPNPTGSDLTYWQQLAAAAVLVRETYLSAPAVVGAGPYVGSRMLRTAFRTSVQKLTALGVPVSRIGLMLGFQSGGAEGRHGLQPLSSWLEFVKLATLSANEVAAETGVDDLWSWGWGVYSKAGIDPDKPVAACVELWTRSPSLCDAPAEAAFDTDTTSGQLSSLPPGAQCLVGGLELRASQLAQATALLGDPSAAFTALLERMAATPLVPVTKADERAAEAAIRASGTRVLAEANSSSATIGFVRGVIVDQLRYAQLSTEQLLAAEQSALSQTVCRDDELPAVGDVRLASKLPFLADVAQVAPLPQPAPAAPPEPASPVAPAAPAVPVAPVAPAAPAVPAAPPSAAAG